MHAVHPPDWSLFSRGTLSGGQVTRGAFKAPWWGVGNAAWGTHSSLLLRKRRWRV